MINTKERESRGVGFALRGFPNRRDKIKYKQKQKKKNWFVLMRWGCE
jgi:hypothetical protein